jgi:TonB family protein
MTLAFPAGRLGAALAASLALHALLAATLGSVVRGWQPGSLLPSIKPATFLATLRAVQPVETPGLPAAAERPARGPYDTATPGAALPAPYYYPASELTERPLVLAPVEPRFPDGAPGTGRVKMRLYIGESGRVDAIDIVEAEPAGAFEAAAAEAFAAARFRPGYRNGRSVKSQLSLEVLFGAPLPVPAPLPVEAQRAVPDNPNAYDAPDRAGIKTRRPR